MLVLPKTIGSLTLERKIGTGNVAESYLATQRNGKPAIVRRILPFIARDPVRLAEIAARVKDLAGFRHPALVHVVGTVEEGGETFMVEDRVDGISLERVIVAARTHNARIPSNLFLHIAVQVCNALEALHSRPSASGADSTLHLGVKPGAVFVAADGKVTVGSFGLTRSPTALPQGGVATAIPPRMEYLSPEQTHADQQITPSSDLFSLGAVLYELLTQESLFRADSNLQTIHRIRRGEVTSQLLKVKARMPGLDKVLYRALAVNPKHRYQRAFVLREDLRGLMSGYSFASLPEDAKEWLAPIFDGQSPQNSHGQAQETGYSGADLDPYDGAEAPEETDVGFAPPSPAPKVDEVDESDLPALPRPVPPSTPSAPDPTASTAAWMPASQGSTPRRASLVDLSDDEAAPENTAAWIAPPESTAGFLPTRDAEGYLKTASDVEAEAGAGGPPHPDEPTQTSPGESPEALLQQPWEASPVESPRPAEPEYALGYPPNDADPPEDPRQSKVFSLAVLGGLAAILICSGGVGAYFWAVNARAERVAAAMHDATPPIVAASDDPAATMAEPTPEAQQAEVPAMPPEPVEPQPVAAPVPQQPVATSVKQAEPTAQSEPVSAPYRKTLPTPTTPPPIVRDPAIAAPAPRPTGMLRPAAPTAAAPTAAAPTAASPTAAAPSATPDGINLDGIATDARAGKLRPDDAAALSAIANTDPRFTRAQALLLSNAQKKGDGAAVERALGALFALPENTYNPQFLAADALYRVNKGQYDKALASAQTAERYWARLPPSQSFATRTQIYEVEAAAWQGKFYGSNGDISALDSAIRGWNRYREHVATANRTDLEKSAAAQITKLEDIRVRLQE